LQTIIALGAFAGFWLVRSSAKEAAREAAAECSPACTDKWLSGNMESRLVNYFSGETGRQLLEDLLRDIQNRRNLSGDNLENQQMENLV